MENPNRRAFDGDASSKDEMAETAEIPTIAKDIMTSGTQTVIINLIRIKIKNLLFSLKTNGTKRTLDFNDYATRKTLAQGMLDLAIFSANAAQLRRVVIFGTPHLFYYFLMITIILSICLQVWQNLESWRKL